MLFKLLNTFVRIASKKQIIVLLDILNNKKLQNDIYITNLFVRTCKILPINYNLKAISSTFGLEFILKSTLLRAFFIILVITAAK